ncbi:MAG: pirin family protein [Mycobacteriales bacterium]
MAVSEVDLRRGGERAVTRWAGTASSHSFSFGPYYDPANVHLGPLLAHNDDLLPPDSGYPPHPHQDLEIVTWVVSGLLEHQRGDGARELLEPGQVQVLSAGSGVVHAERAVSSSEGPLRFVQVWLRPDTLGSTPSYRRADVRGLLEVEGLVLVAGATGSGAVLTLSCSGACLRAGRLHPGAVSELPEAALRHIYVTHGRVRVEPADCALEDGDAVRLRESPLIRLVAEEAAEVLVWDLPPEVRWEG